MKRLIQDTFNTHEKAKPHPRGEQSQRFREPNTLTSAARTFEVPAASHPFFAAPWTLISSPRTIIRN